ncbi:stationary phase inducible protein CsiE [[Pantoea] beijingensis]|uniref:Stationary phase inducible protein CsiE n=1 Tax=[Pantoea] beijingensis TaxID=1324864 RepID=A0A443IG07_9GAMM|nr:MULTISPECIES: stationary phase inducible protein CsiE [Erwiniaceae]RWR02972.1 stationary phase inducible protein CsiE [[Pantoea] beijingensis]
MSSASTTAPLLSRSQRRCHLLLALYLPDTSLTLDKLCQLNGVDSHLARQDIAEAGEEIQRYHQLDIRPMQDGSYQLSGAELDRRLCLHHWLRRALRLSPDFIKSHFAPALRQRLKAHQVEKALYDDKNLQALIQHCSQRLQRNFDERDRQFLQLFMQFSLCQQTQADFTPLQQQWLAIKAEREAAADIVKHWQKRRNPPPHANEIDFYALLFSMMHTPHAEQIHHENEQLLMRLVQQLIQRFQALSGMRFSDEQGLSYQLYTHLAQALDRSHFAVGIDSSLGEEVTRLYPKLLRTTRQALADFETGYSIRFSEQELGLITVIFGAWLMQESDLQEKQVLLLTGSDKELELEIEQQLRELTLLPLNIKYLDMFDFQQRGASKGIALVITPYATPLPLYSPPLIHAELPLSHYQQQRIRTLLEA